MKRLWGLLWITAALVAGVSFWPRTSEAKQPSPPPLLQGSWTFDPARSDDHARHPSRGMGGGMRGGMGGGGRHGGGMRGGGMGGGMRGGGGDRARGDDDHSSASRAPQKLIIDQLEAEVHVIEDGRPPRVFEIEQKHKDASAPGVVGAPASYHGRKLKVEEDLGGGARLEQEYELSKDRATLTVTTRHKGGRGSIPDNKSVYQRATAG